MGLGLPGDAWWRTVPVLARALRVVTFDNRGCGRSERPAGRSTLAGMAADAVSVLDAAGIARAHVYGISMGGMIAQELALRYPDRVDALVLGATSAGGAAATPPDARRWPSSGAAPRSPTRRAAGRPCRTCTASARAARAARASARTSRAGGAYRFDPVGYGAQLAAATGHDAAARLGDITAPTLVVHGAEDRMVPPANGRALAAAIAGARLLELDDAAHLYTTDEPAADEAVLEFLRLPLARTASKKRPTSASASGASVV